MGPRPGLRGRPVAKSLMRLRNSLTPLPGVPREHTRAILLKLIVLVARIVPRAGNGRAAGAQLPDAARKPRTRGLRARGHPVGDAADLKRREQRHRDHRLLAAGVALVGRTAKPVNGFGVVLCHTATCRVHEAKGSLPGSMALLGRPPEPGHGSAVVLRRAATVLVPLAELGLRLGVSRLGESAQRSDVQLGDANLRRIGPWRVGQRQFGWNRSAVGGDVSPFLRQRRCVTSHRLRWLAPHSPLAPGGPRLSRSRYLVRGFHPCAWSSPTAEGDRVGARWSVPVLRGPGAGVCVC